MLQFSIWKKGLIWSLCLLGIVFSAPNFFYAKVEKANDANALVQAGVVATPEMETDISGWPEFLPSMLVNLGLDLRGGAHLLVEVAVEDVYADRLDSMWPEVRDVLREVKDEVGSVRRQDSDPNELRVKIGEPVGMPKALKVVGDLTRPVVTLTGAGSRDFEVSNEGDVLIFTLSEAEMIAMDDRTMQQSLEIIRRRVDEAGTREPTIQRQGADRVLVQVPGIGSAEELLDLIGQTAKLSFLSVVQQTTNPDIRAGSGNVVYPHADQEGIYFVLDRVAVVTGDQLVDAQPTLIKMGGLR